jgi:hypothetical protein
MVIRWNKNRRENNRVAFFDSPPDPLLACEEPFIEKIEPPHNQFPFCFPEYWEAADPVPVPGKANGEEE